MSKPFKVVVINGQEWYRYREQTKSACPECGETYEHLMLERMDGMKAPSAKVCPECDWFEDLNLQRHLANNAA
jgi:ssDNA-binding Zn-finger/Zn-ribbon topoisomerase 1